MLKTICIITVTGALSAVLLLAGGCARQPELADPRARKAEMAEPRESEAAGAALGFTLKDIDGRDTKLADYTGKVILMVNVASKCGLTPQYAGLESVYGKYRDRGFVVLGFPANNFGGQEPGTEEEIKQFCSLNYNVTFPMFSKISVKGDDADPLYKYLTALDTAPQPKGDISWNFEKFLVNREGEVVARFSPKTTPEDAVLVAAIEKELAP